MVIGLNWNLDDAVDPEFGALFAEALESDGLAGLSEVLTSDVNWHITAGRLAGTYTGIETVTELLGRMKAHGIRFALFDTLVSDAHCGLLLVYEREAGGEKRDAYGMWLMHVDAGVASECFCYFEDQAAFEALVEGL